MVVKKVNLSVTEKSNKNSKSGEFVMLKTNRNLKKSGRPFFMSIIEKSNKNNKSGEFVMLKANRKLKTSGRSFFMSKAFGRLSRHLSRNFFNVKKAFYSLAVLGLLTSLVSCGCDNPVGPNPPTTNEVDPTNIILPTNGADSQLDRNIILYPENTVALSIPIDINILDALGLKLDGDLTTNDVSITSSIGADPVANLNGLTLVGHTISGEFKLNRRLDFENPIDTNRDNDYEVANYNVQISNSINTNLLFDTNFKLILRIYDLVAEPSKIEILIDSFHLSLNTQVRGIKELYLYETVFVADPRVGNDPNDFLSSSLIASSNIIGTSYPGSDISKLYDKDDVNDAFLTAINNSSNAYHRLTFDFIEPVNLQKVAIRGRQAGGYQGFYFIIRDLNDNILSVHRATGSAARGSGSDVSAVSTYSFVPTYLNPITNVGIRMNNSFFDIAEHTTDVILTENFSVMSGYEYERGFVTFDGLGADFSLFNTENVFFINNVIFGLSFINAPDAEVAGDGDGNNLYEMGSVTISNIDGGLTNFNLTVKVVNIPSIASLLSNAVSYTVRPDQYVIVSNLTELVDQTTLINAIDLGIGTFNYNVVGADSNYFRVIGNVLQTVAPSGFDPFGRTEYNLEVVYQPETGEAATNLRVNVQLGDFLNEITASAPWTNRGAHQSLVLSDGTILIISGINSPPRAERNSVLSEIWGSGDGGNTWRLVSGTVSALTRGEFQAVVLPNDDILVMGGYVGIRENPTNTFGLGVISNDVRISRDRGSSWENISPPTGRWGRRFAFQAVVLQNGDILVMGGKNNFGDSAMNDIWRSSDGGRSWSQVTASAPWPARSDFQALVLENGDVLVMGGEGETSTTYTDDIWRSSDGGVSWTEIQATGDWKGRREFQALALPNNRIVVMGGIVRSTGAFSENFQLTSVNDILLSTNNGTNWSTIRNTFLPPIPSSPYPRFDQVRPGVYEPIQPLSYPSGVWRDRYQFQSVITKNNDILIIGGRYFRAPIIDDGSLILGAAIEGNLNDVWRIGPVDPNQPLN